MNQEKKIVNILIVDDEVAINKLNQGANDHFGLYLDKGSYSFTVNIIEEKINSPERLRNYLKNKPTPAPDFILLDWLFKNEGDEINNSYTGKIILKELMESKAKAYRNELEDNLNDLYQNLEVIAISSFIHTPPISNLEDMLLGGCIAAVAKDTFHLEKEKSFLLECLRKWYLAKAEDLDPKPMYDGNRFGELDPNFRIVWLANRELLEDNREDELIIKDKTGNISLELSNYFVPFKKIVTGDSFDNIKNIHSHLDQDKSHITRRFLRGVEYADDETMRPGEVHRWFHIALEKALKGKEEYYFVFEYLIKKGVDKFIKEKLPNLIREGKVKIKTS